MTNDKLPKEITEQINNEAEIYANKYLNGKVNTHEFSLIEDGYNAGATEWAPWKVKYNELHSELHETKQQADNLRIAYDELGRKAQRIADALEFVKANGLCSETTEMINSALQQFKDGGKEVARPERNVSIGEHITYCHACGFPVDECNCIENNNPTK